MPYTCMQLQVKIFLIRRLSKELKRKYIHLLANPNVVSLGYCKPPPSRFMEIAPGQKVLCIGVIKNDPSIDNLPKIAVYESPTKHVEVPVCVREEGEIKML